MKPANTIIRSILGPAKRDIRPLACAVDAVIDLMFVQSVPMDGILVTKHIYPDVAKLLHKRPGTVSRQVERLANKCWDTLVDRKLLLEYIGTDSIHNISAPRDVIFYLAVYVYTGIPFFTAIQDQSQLFS